MEELLASIRKAISDDIGDVPASMGASSQGTLFKGAMRELRVKMPDEQPARPSSADEIRDIRERMSRSRTVPVEMAPPARAEAQPRHTEAFRSASPPVQQPPAAEPVIRKAAAPGRGYGFAGILGGASARSAEVRLPHSAPPPNLRPTISAVETLSEAEPADIDYELYEEPPRHFAPRPAAASGRAAEAHVDWADEPPPSYPLPAPLPEAPRPRSAGQPIMSDETSAAANAAFNRLAETLMSRALGDRSIEDIARDLLRVMLKQWLDDNLPQLVERLVREEIERVARRGH